MTWNNAKIPAKRGFFWVIGLMSLLLAGTQAATAEAPHRTYWDRLLHAENGRSRVHSKEFFVTETGASELENERLAFIKLLKSTDGQAVACQFPARYKWIQKESSDIPKIDLGRCHELGKFVKNFQKKNFYIAYVSEFLDAPASAFGHLMLVFHDNEMPMELADTIHFAASTNREGAMQYAIKGLSGGFEGYFLREPFFSKKKDYLLFEQRAIHLYKIELSADELENIIHHLFELRKAKFKYYFVDENCAFHLAELINIANPNKDYSITPNRPILPIDIVRLHASHTTQHKTLTPTIVREKYLSETLSETENAHLQAVVNQSESIEPSDSDQLKEWLSLHYQYAFRRRRSPYANHAEIEALDFNESSHNLQLPDPSQLNTLNSWGVGLQQYKSASYVRIRWTPLGNESPQEQISRESRLNALEATVDVNKDQLQINRLTVFSINTTPNNLNMHRPWSWHMSLSLNRDNAENKLISEVDIGIGKTWILKKIRFESFVGPGIEHREQTYAYLKPKLSVLTLIDQDIQIGISAYWKIFAHSNYNANELTLQFKNIQLKHRVTGASENTLLVNIPY